MRKNRSTPIAMLALLILCSPAIHASSKSTTKCKTPKKLHYKSPWKRTNAQLGFSMKSGNTNSQDFSGKLHIYHRLNRWRKILKLEYTLSRSEGVTSKNKFYGEGQTQYYFHGSNHLYADVNGTVDQFSPYSYQVVGAGGYGRDIIKRKRFRWNFEIGPGYMRSKGRDSGTIFDQLILNLQSNIYWKISSNCFFHEEFTSDFGKENSRTISIASIRNKLVGHLGIQLSFKAEYNSQIPPLSDKTKKLDTTTEVALIYNFV